MDKGIEGNRNSPTGLCQLVPLGSHSKMVLVPNVRALLHMANERMCTSVLGVWDFMSMLKDTIRKLDNEGLYSRLIFQMCCSGPLPRKTLVWRYPVRGVKWTLKLGEVRTKKQTEGGELREKS